MQSNKSLSEKEIQKINFSNTLHKSLDKFIQSCLNKFKLIEPPKDLYDKCGLDKNDIISHKSTIPDLVIWNKTFNKNECFEDSIISNISPFPRYKFFIRLNQSKEKKKKLDKSIQKTKNKMAKKNMSNQSNLKSNSENIEEKLNTSFEVDNPEKNVEKIFEGGTPFEKENVENLSKLMENMDLKDKNNKKLKENDKDAPNEKTYKKQNNYSLFSEKLMSSDSSCINEDNSNFIKFMKSHHTHGPNSKQYLVLNEDNNNLIFNNTSNSKTNNKCVYQNKYVINQLTKNSSFQTDINYQNSPYYEYNSNNNKNNLYSINKSSKYSMLSSSIKKSKKTMNDYYQNQFKKNELLMNFVYSYLEKRGWILFENCGNYISNFTSFELFAFLTNILKNDNDLKLFMIGMANSSTIFNGEQIYIILSQTLPIILQKKQYELMQQEKDVEKSNKNNENEINNSKKISEEKNEKNVQSDNNLNLHEGQNNNYNDYEDKNNKEIFKINEGDENYYNFNLKENDLFMNEEQSIKYDIFDSSIFGQSHK